MSVPPCGYELDLKRERLRQLFGLRSKGNTTVTLPHGLTPIVGQGSTTCRVVFMMKRLYKARRALLVEEERERSPLIDASRRRKYERSEFFSILLGKCFADFRGEAGAAGRGGA